MFLLQAHRTWMTWALSLPPLLWTCLILFKITPITKLRSVTPVGQDYVVTWMKPGWQTNLPALSDVKVLFQNQLLIISTRQKSSRRVEGVEISPRPVLLQLNCPGIYSDSMWESDGWCGWWFASVRVVGNSQPNRITLELWRIWMRRSSASCGRSCGRIYMRHPHWLRCQSWDARKTRVEIAVITITNRFFPQFSLPIRLYIPLVPPGISVLLLHFRGPQSPEIGLDRASLYDPRRTTQRLLQLFLRSHPVRKSSLQFSYLMPNPWLTRQGTLLRSSSFSSQDDSWGARLPFSS